MQRLITRCFLRSNGKNTLAVKLDNFQYAQGVPWRGDTKTETVSRSVISR